MVDILMATYNGERYISEQIESILNQTYKNWKLYIRDDGSNDNTKEIIKKYTAKYPQKIIFIEDNKRGLGAKGNFSELLKYSSSKYCMFADQDDVWLDYKIEISLNKMKKLELKYGSELPLIVHTDLKVVDENLDLINESFWKYQNIDGNETRLNKIVVQNNITGCTMLMNKAIVDKCKHIPKDCIMHDWWIGLIASSFGKIGVVNEPTIMYRQHNNNEVGAHNYNSVKYILSKLRSFNSVKKSISNSILQAKKFNEIFEDELNNENKYTINEFKSLKDINFIIRKIKMIKNKFYKNGLIKTIVYIILI